MKIDNLIDVLIDDDYNITILDNGIEIDLEVFSKNSPDLLGSIIKVMEDATVQEEDYLKAEKAVQLKNKYLKD